MERVPCVCGSEDHKVMFIERGFNIVKCNKCGLIFTNPRLTQEKIRRLMDISAERGNDAVIKIAGTKTDSRPFLRNADKRFEQLVEKLKKMGAGPRLLDVGAGTSSLVKIANKNGFKAEGFDIAPKRVEKAVSINKVKITCAPSLEAAKYPSNYFDVITTWEVLEHIPNQKEFLEEVNRIMKTGGLFVIQCPNGDFALFKIWLFENIVPFLKSLINPSCGYCVPEFHLYYYSMPLLRKALEDSGFEVKESLTYRMYYERSWIVLFLHELVYWQAKLVNFISRGRLDSNVFLLVIAKKK